MSEERREKIDGAYASFLLAMTRTGILTLDLANFSPGSYGTRDEPLHSLRSALNDAVEAYDRLETAVGLPEGEKPYFRRHRPARSS